MKLLGRHAFYGLVTVGGVAGAAYDISKARTNPDGSQTFTLSDGLGYGVMAGVGVTFGYQALAIGVGEFSARSALRKMATQASLPVPPHAASIQRQTLEMIQTQQAKRMLKPPIFQGFGADQATLGRIRANNALLQHTRTQ